MAYPQNFLMANAFTKQWEKGYVNHPKDPGGATYNGVSLRFLKQTGIDINGDGHINAADIQDLYRRKDQARVDEIFYRAFWLEPGLERFPDVRVQTFLYDTSVNTGRSQSVKCLQRAINALLRREEIEDDGKVGKLTLAAYRRVLEARGGLALALAAIKKRLDFHNLLNARSPYPDGRDYRPFIKGWRNRCNALKNYVGGLE